MPRRVRGVDGLGDRYWHVYTTLYRTGNWWEPTHSMGSSAQLRRPWEGRARVHVWLTHCALRQKLTQHGRATLLQQKLLKRDIHMLSSMLVSSTYRALNKSYISWATKHTHYLKNYMPSEDFHGSFWWYHLPFLSWLNLWISLTVEFVQLFFLNSFIGI